MRGWTGDLRIPHRVATGDGQLTPDTCRGDRMPATERVGQSTKSLRSSPLRGSVSREGGNKPIG